MKKYELIVRKKIMTPSGKKLSDEKLRRLNGLISEDIELDDEAESKDIVMKFMQLHPECNSIDWITDIL